MTLTAGVLTLVSESSSTVNAVSTAASGGVGPYTQQWYRSTTTGFSPGGGNILAGQTALSLSDSGLIPNTPYYYKVVYTDTGNSNATVNSTQLVVTTFSPSQNQNQFMQAPFLGDLDLKVGPTNVVGMIVDSSQSGFLYAGSAVKIVNNALGVPSFIGCTADADAVAGFIAYDIKSRLYKPGDRAEVALQGTCLFLYATTAIARFGQVVLDVTSPGSVQSAVGQTGAAIVGYAYDQASAYGQLIRVIVGTPSFQVVA